ncbi:MAG: nucleoside triphosphate pyrophosphohydrolase [Chloroherpetonaceae bacterium]|nr:nucleoside triphosphate pyrophosphohydrolase [Chloroherpetonaceae bacterium]
MKSSNAMDLNKQQLQNVQGVTLGEKFERLYKIVQLLRKECPWDQKQTPDSLLHLTIEEVFEMVHAVDVKDDNELKKELGDILLHLCFQSILAEERRAFEMESVLDAISEKLIFRHPHVFGEATVSDEGDVKRKWEELKLKEGRKSVLEGVPKAMPQLLRAFRMQEKAAGVSFDWKQSEEVLLKLGEEMAELKNASSQEEREGEFGDILFTLVNYSRFIGVNPEDALRKTNEKFFRRFQHIEKRVAESGKSWKDYDLTELDVFWNEAKQMEAQKN